MRWGGRVRIGIEPRMPEERREETTITVRFVPLVRKPGGGFN
jgi:hypothetical protein